MPSPRSLAIVVPLYNEAEGAAAFHARLRAVVDALPYAVRIWYVDDGSRDATGQALDAICAADPRVTAVELSRNFGHQAALTAGLDAADGDFIVMLDGDGQHPPELIPEMLRLAESGYDMVLTQRAEDPGIPLFKRGTAGAFYRLINRVGDTQVLPGGADFRLINRRAADALRGMREYHRFLRGMTAWIGFKSVILPFTPGERMSGQTKYTLRKMLRLASDAIFSFSLVPLYIGLSMGGLMLVLALAEMIYVLSFWVSGRQASLAPGWSSLMFVILVVGGILMILLGFIGVYIGFIFQEVKHRPLYLVRSRRGGATEEKEE